jgi:hypothetical protein
MLLKEEGGEGRMALGVDNQAAIRATNAFQSCPGHYLVNKFYDNLRLLLPNDNNRKLTVRWTLGHKGITGNKAADEQAKREAKGEASDGNNLPRSLRTKMNTPIPLPLSKAAIKQNFNAKIN